MDVLLVDDSRVMRQLVRRTLRQAGFDLGTVHEAEHGKEALAKLAGFKPQLILSDWNMPTMTGIEFLAALRAKGDKTPFGFVTSESTGAMSQKARETGASFLLTKPFTAEDFRSALIGTGIKPSAALGGGQAIQLVTGAIDHTTIGTVFKRLVSQPVTVAEGPKLVPSVTPSVACTWVDTENTVLYAGFMELPLAVYIGTAVGLRPPDSAKEALATRTVPEGLQGDVKEILNILSRTFNDAGSKHVRLGQVSYPPAPALKEATAFDAQAKARRDFLVTVQGFGAGKLSLVATGPIFIVPDPALAAA